MIVGLESGDLIIWRAEKAFSSWTRLYEFPSYFSHSLSVKRIKFSLRYSNTDNDEYTVATAGGDHTVRIFKFRLN